METSQDEGGGVPSERGLQEDRGGGYRGTVVGVAVDEP